MNKLIKVISLVCIVITGTASAMNPGDKPQGTKRERGSQPKRAAKAAAQKKIAKLVATRESYPEEIKGWKNLLYKWLHEAVESNDVEEVKNILRYYYLDWNVGIGAEQVTLVHKAAFEGHTEILKLLLEKGAYADVPLVDGRTALHMACEQGHLTEMVHLVQHGANKAARTNSGQTIWGLAAQGAKNFSKSFDIIFGPNPALVHSPEFPEGSSGLTSSGSGSAEVGLDIEKLEMKEFAAPYVLSVMKRRVE